MSTRFALVLVLIAVYAVFLPWFAAKVSSTLEDLWYDWTRGKK